MENQKRCRAGGYTACLPRGRILGTSRESEPRTFNRLLGSIRLFLGRSRNNSNLQGPFLVIEPCGSGQFAEVYQQAVVNTTLPPAENTRGVTGCEEYNDTSFLSRSRLTSRGLFLSLHGVRRIDGLVLGMLAKVLGCAAAKLGCLSGI